MTESKNNCIFCDISSQLSSNKCIFLESEHCFAIPDINPKTQGHTLIITKKHFSNLMETDDFELKDAILLSKKTAKKLIEKYPNIKGFNYVSNQNKEANQVIFHLHIHVVPRY